MTKIYEYIKIALMNIKSNKGRSALTMLGIIIGISSVILIVSAGTGIKAGVSGQLNSLVGGYVELYSNPNDKDGNFIRFNNDDLDILVSEIDHVKGATDLWMMNGGTAQSNKGTFDVAATFGNEFLQYYNTAPLVRGRYFTKSEYQKGSKVCVISESSAKKLFGSTDVIGMEISFTLYGVTQEYTIIGIRQDNKSAMKGMVFATGDVEMEIPTTVLENVYGYYTEEFSEFFIFADSAEYVQGIAKRAKNILEARYNIRGKDMIQIYDLASQVDQITGVLNYITIFVVLVAAISLILTLLTGFKKIRNCHKYILVCKAFSIMTIISSLISLISAFIFTSSSVETIAQTNEIEYTLSINITTGIYLFTILEIAAGISNLLSHNLITNNDESN